MNMNVEEVTESALALPSEARVWLADRLVECLDPAENGNLHTLWVVEAHRRLNEVRSGSVEIIPGPEALKRVRPLVTAAEAVPSASCSLAVGPNMTREFDVVIEQESMATMWPRSQPCRSATLRPGHWTH